MSEVRTRGGAERSVNTLFLKSYQIDKDLSSRSVDLISPLPRSVYTLPPHLLSSPLLQPANYASSSITHFSAAKDHLDEE